MIRKCILMIPFAALVALSFGCHTTHPADQGAMLGGVAGAVTGAAIGEHNGNAAAGAAIGTAVGALTGAVVGNEIARSEQIIEERLGRRLSGAVRMDDVIAMSQAGVGDEVIITHIRANGVAERPKAGDVIAMHQQGVSEKVINALQETGGPPVERRTVYRDRPVIVEEHYYGPGFDPWCRYDYWPHRHRHPGRVHWGFSFSN